MARSETWPANKSYGSAGGCSRWDTSLEVVADYQAAQKTLDPSLPRGFVALEGYPYRPVTGSISAEVGPKMQGRPQALSPRHSEGRPLWGCRRAVTSAGRLEAAPPPMKLSHGRYMLTVP